MINHPKRKLDHWRDKVKPNAALKTRAVINHNVIIIIIKKRCVDQHDGNFRVQLQCCYLHEGGAGV